MLYFSEIVGTKVHTEDQIHVGKLVDLIFTASETPFITKLIILTEKKDTIIVPTQYVHKLNGSITLSKNYEIAELADNELYIVKNLLDKQIIDIKGNKVVRVNDIIMQQAPSLYVVGVDTGLLSIFRWFGFEDVIIKLLNLCRIKYHAHMLSWADIQPLELARGEVRLKEEEDKLQRVRPEDLADHLEETNILNTQRILNILDEDFAAEVINNLNINYQTALFKKFSIQKAAKVISLLDPDEAVDILLTLSHEKVEHILELLTPEKKDDIVYLFNLSKTPIGDLITSEYFTADSNATVRQIIDSMQKNTNDYSHVNYVYVTNKKNQLVGVCNLRELIMQKLDSPIYKFMIQNVIVIHLSTPEEIAIKKMLKYKLYALPVINQDKHMLGIVTFDDVSEYLLEKLK